MTKLLAGVFASIGAMFGGLFGGHVATTTMPWDNGSTTPSHHMMGTTTPAWGDHEGSTTPRWDNGSTTPNHMNINGVMGTVASIDGDILTVTGHATPKTATTTYTVDATNAKIFKVGSSNARPATTTISAIQVNDSVIVQGTVNGTSVTASSIIDGVLGHMMGGSGQRNGQPQAQ
ncbi:MAG: hypothetical protein P4M11_10535 [Candidatus Pacebacteria bacterium]|nr:hypothetical protein [Candidatus Paceibacterota bacterium]